MRAVLLGPVVSSLSAQIRLLRQMKINRKTDLLVGIDGGTQAWFNLGYQPHFAVGDWDSLPNKKRILSKLPHITLPVRKDRTDLFFAILAAIEAGADEILCLGVTGRRPDHHMAALYDLAFFSTGELGKLKSICAIGEEAEYHFLSPTISTWRSSVLKGKTVSLFSIGGLAKGVTLSGFRYTLSDAVLRPSSLGLSNVVEKKRCEVHLRSGQLLIILPRDNSI